MRMTHIDIAPEFNRNDPTVQQAGVEHTGWTLIQLACERMGLADLSGKAVLDVGCGVRFTQTIINRNIPIGSYTGIDIDNRMMDYLSSNVKDDRFSFHYWNVYHLTYNPGGEQLSSRTKLPLADGRKFDVIWLFSVFTHLSPEDARSMLRVLRRYIAQDGKLFFSAFLDHGISGFEDRDPSQSLHFAYYGEDLMRQILADAGWLVVAIHDAVREKWIMDHLVCEPAPVSRPNFWKAIAARLGTG